jgi:hypothetical protein
MADALADGLSVSEAAERLNVSYKSAEMALARLRSKAHAVMRAGAAAIVPPVLRLWRHSTVRAATVSTSTVAAGLVVLFLASPPPSSLRPSPAHRHASAPVHAIDHVEKLAMRTAVSHHGVQRTAIASLRQHRDSSSRRASHRSHPLLRVPGTRTHGVDIGESGVDRTHPHESILDSVRRCIRNGVGLDPQALGCRG